MKNAILFVLVALAAVVLAEGQYYVPRAYYTIDPEGHASPPVPLRRLRRSFNPLPYANGGDANANANAEAWGGGSANANANARAFGTGGGWGSPGQQRYGASNPNVLSAGMTRRLAGPLVGARSVTASSSVAVDSTGNGYYDQYTSVSN